MRSTQYLLVWFIILLVSCSEEIKLPINNSFIKLYGGEKPDFGITVEHLEEGGYIFLGSSLSNPESGKGKEMCVIKTDNQGNRVWTKYFGKEGNDLGKDIKATPDGGFLILGDLAETPTDPEVTDYYLIKTDAKGEMLWSKKFGSPSQNEQAKSVNITLDGGIIITGNLIKMDGSSYLYIIKTDGNGELIWEKTIGLQSLPNEIGKSIVTLPDGSFVLCGTEKGRKLSDRSDADIRVMKISANGAVIWSYSYGGPTSQTGFEIQSYPGGFIVVGTMKTMEKDTDIFLLNIDYQGNLLWLKSFGGNLNEEGFSVNLSSDGGFTLCGTTESYGEGGKDIYLIKVDKEGNELWFKTFGGSEDDEGYKVIQVQDNGIVIAGTIGFDSANTMMGLIKTDAKGQLSK